MGKHEKGNRIIYNCSSSQHEFQSQKYNYVPHANRNKKNNTAKKTNLKELVGKVMLDLRNWTKSEGKLSPKYYRPFTIAEKLSDVTFRVE